jgi:hypothetical protein
MLLKVSATDRPSCDQILKASLVKKYLSCVPSDKVEDDSNYNTEESNIDLLGTIKVPKNLQKLRAMMPKSNYAASTAGSKRYAVDRELLGSKDGQSE